MPTSHPQTSRPGIERPARTTKKRISDDEWLMHKRTIERLYLDDGRDVREVRDTMKRDFGFDAHEKAYKRKFEEWGLIKNIPKDEGLFMVKKRERRREEEGKETIFHRRRRPDGPLQLVLDEKVDRIADRYSHDLNSYPVEPASTPDNIQYDTPDVTPADEIPRRRKGESAAPSSGSEWAFSQVVDRHDNQYYPSNDHHLMGQQASAMAGMNTLPPISSMAPMSGISMMPESVTSHPSGSLNSAVNVHMNGNMHGSANPSVNNVNGMGWDPWGNNSYF